MEQLTRGRKQGEETSSQQRTKAKKTQVKTAEKRTKTTKTKTKIFANKEFEEDDMAKGLWLLKIFKKSKPKKIHQVKIPDYSLKTGKINIH